MDYANLHQWLQADGAGLCHQDRTDADRQIGGPCPALGDVSELVGEARSGVDIK